MSSVDNRIVNMQFNSSQFTKGAADSRKSLQDLENQISKSARGPGIDSMGRSVDGVKAKFSALQVAGVAAIGTIAVKATNMASNFLKGFTISPIMDGFREYETQLKSVTTIMANTDAPVGRVNKALDQLNTYSDQTIYNFGEMARNIGTFTAAGVGLKESVASIQGLSNIAALSGSSSQQASTAMYQLSQAIAAGRVGLQDWNSVVNAGMGGKKFQSALAQTAVAMGQVDEAAVKLGKRVTISGESFRNSIMAKPGQESWLTSDVLTKTLSLMDGRLSRAAIANNNLKWSSQEVNKELERQKDILRDQGFNEEQIKNLTRMANSSYKAATEVKTFTQLIDTTKESIGSVYAQAFEEVLGDAAEAKKMWTGVADIVKGQVDGFGRLLLGSLRAWQEQGGRTALLEGFGNAFEALSKIVGAVRDAFRDVFPPDAQSGLATASKGFRDLTEALIPGENTIKAIRGIFGVLFSVINIGITGVKILGAIFGGVLKLIFNGSESARGGIFSLIGEVANAIVAFNNWLTANDRIFKMLEKIGGVAATVFSPLVSVVKAIGDALGALFTGDFSGFVDSLGVAKGYLAGFGANVAGALAAVTAPIGFLSDAFAKVRDALAGVADEFASAKDVMGQFSGPAKTIGDSFNKIKDGANSAKDAVSGMFSGASGGGGDKAASSIGAAVGSTEQLDGASAKLKAFFIAAKAIAVQGYTSLGNAIVSGIKWIGDQLSDLFGGWDALEWASVINAVFSGALILSIKKITDGIGDFTQIGGAVVGSFNQLTDTLKYMQNAVRAQLILNIGIAVALLTASLIALSFVPLPKLAQGLGALAITMGILIVAMSAMDKIGKTVDEDGNVVQNFNANLIALSVGMALIAGSMVLLATAVKIFGSMDIKTLLKGLGAMAIAMLVMVGAVKVVAGLKGQFIQAGIGIAAMATALLILSAAVLAFGSMDLGTLQQGLGAIAIALLAMTISLSALGAVGPATLAGGAALVLLAGAMSVLVPAITALGLLPMDVLVQGMAAFGIALLTMTISLAALGAVGPATLAGGAALILLATAMSVLIPFIITLGSLSLGTVVQGIAALAAVLAVAAVAIGVIGGIALIVGPGLLMLGGALALIGVGMLAFGTGFAIMAAAGTAGAAVLVAGFTTFMALLPQLAVQVAAAFVAFLKTMAAAAPKVRQYMTTIIKNLLGVVIDNVPTIGKLFTVLINTGLNVIRKTVPNFVATGIVVLKSFLNGLAQNIAQLATFGIRVVTEFMKAVGAQAGPLTDRGAKMLIQFLNGIANAIRNNAADMRAAGKNIASAIVEGLTGGLRDAIGSVAAKARELAQSAISAAKGALKINSPSKVFEEIGAGVGEGLSNGIFGATKRAVGAAVYMANSVIAAGSSIVDRYQYRVTAAQTAASRTAAIASASETYAARLKIAKGKGAAAKASKKAKAEAQAKADRTAADKAATAVDAANTAVERAKAFEAADLLGRGDMRSEDSRNAAKRATELLAQAAGQNAAAQKYAKSNKKLSDELKRSAKVAADQAAVFAASANNLQNEAVGYYTQTISERIAAINEANAADSQARIDAAQYEAADAKGKADIMTARAAASEARAQAANAAAQSLMAQAQSLASTNAAEAFRLLDRAETLAADARDAANKAEEQRKQAETDRNNGNPSSSAGSSTTALTPSRLVLEDAASVVDRYTTSLAMAQEAALATQQPTLVFEQTNNSPVALSSSDIYRQTQNLVSLAGMRVNNNR